MRRFILLAKALADPQRARILLALRGGELCVCQLVELLGLAGSTVSRHLSLLSHAGLVEWRKQERWVYYRLPGCRTPPIVRAALAWLYQSLADSPEARGDRRRLERILRTDPSQLCQRQLERARS